MGVTEVVAGFGPRESAEFPTSVKDVLARFVLELRPDVICHLEHGTYFRLSPWPWHFCARISHRPVCLLAGRYARPVTRFAVGGFSASSECVAF
jgi:hypothetical protein